MKKHPLLLSVPFLEGITILWNIFEGGSTIFLGFLTHSLSLVGFGLSSMVEVAVSCVVLWSMVNHNEKKEHKALRIIGGAYLIVAGYIAVEAISRLKNADAPDASPYGIVLMLFTVVIMLCLAGLKYRAGKILNRKTLLADAKFSLIDGLVAVAVGIGLVLNYFFHLWWIDIVAALIISSFALKEGVEELKS